MNDEDMKIYIPNTGNVGRAETESDEVKIYTCSSAPRSETPAAEQSEHLP